MKRTVFIIHPSADRAIAERLCTYLEQNGAPCWMAPRDVMPGQNYGAAIVDAIDECRVFVLLLSSESNKSRQVPGRRKIRRAPRSNPRLAKKGFERRNTRDRATTVALCGGSSGFAAIL